MAVPTRTQVGTYQTTAGGGNSGVVTASSITGSNGNLLVLLYFYNAQLDVTAGLNLTPATTIGGTWSGTWTRRAFCTRGLLIPGQYGEGVEIWTSPISGSPSGTVTASLNYAPTDGWEGFWLEEVSGQNATPIGLTASGTRTASTSTFNTDFGSTPAVDSLCFGIVHDDNDTGPLVTPPSGWTEANEQSPVWGAISEYAFKSGSSVQSPQWSGFTNSGSTAITGAAIEIKAAASGLTLGLSGQSVTSSAGSSALGHSQALAGSSVTVSAGTVTPVIGIAAALTGTAVASAAGTLASARTLALGGSAVTSAAGTISASSATAVIAYPIDIGSTRNRPGRGPYSLGRYFRPKNDAFADPASAISAALSGSQVATAAGTLGVQISIPVSGLSSSVAAGTITASTGANLTLGLTGQAVTASAGALAPSFTIPLTGQSVTVSSGIITASAGSNVTLSLTGQSVTVTAGSLALGVSLGLGGSQVAVNAGVLPGDKFLSLTGSVVTVSSGALGTSRVLALLGTQVTAAGGTITTSGGDNNAISYSGARRIVYVISTTGLRKWADYIPVVYQTPTVDKINRFDDLGALAVQTLSSPVGQIWRDYIPVGIVSGAQYYRWRTDDLGYIPVVEVI